MAAAGAAAQPCWTARLLVRLRGPHFPLPFGEPFSSGFARAGRAGRCVCVGGERERQFRDLQAPCAVSRTWVPPGGFFALRPAVFLFETGRALHNCFVWDSHRYRACDPKTGGALRNKAQPPSSIRRFLPVSEVEREPCFLVGEERVANASRLLLTPSRFCLQSAGNRLG